MISEHIALGRKAFSEELQDVLRISPIPARMHGGLIRYVAHHKEPGGFLTAVLENNLRRACAKADDENKYLLFDYVVFLHNRCPAACWGSEDAVTKWIEQE